MKPVEKLVKATIEEKPAQVKDVLDQVLRGKIASAYKSLKESKDKPPCDCGNPNASWRGDKEGKREYMCDECAKKGKKATGSYNEIPYTSAKYKKILSSGKGARIIATGGGYADTVEFGKDIDDKKAKEILAKDKLDMIIKNAEIAVKNGKAGIKNRKFMIVMN